MDARLVMIKGVALAPAESGSELTSVRFDRFVFDLSDLIKDDGVRVPRPSEYPVRALLAPTPDMLAADGTAWPTTFRRGTTSSACRFWP